jgi:glycosyltransferase involved in cell wall biosynthesis
MRILTIAACPFPTRQGSQVLIRQTAQALAARGHDVRVAAYAGGEPIPCAVPILRSARLPGAGRLAAGPSLARPWLDAALALRVARVTRARSAWRPDVIHAHNAGGAIAALAAAGGVPVVYHAHGLLEAELPSYFGPRPRAAARVLGRRLDRALPRRAAATIALTQPAREALLRAGADPARVHVVPPAIAAGTDDEGAAAAARAARERACPGGEPLIVYAGNPDGYQDIPTLLDAAVLLREGPGKDARIVFALTRDERALSRAIAARGLGPRAAVRVAGWEETAALLRACDAAVVPRSDPHGFPMKLLNALALGAPVVAHAASAHGLEDGVHALLARDAAGFAGGLARVLRDPALALRLRAEGRDHARKAHDPSLAAARLEAILRGSVW